MQRLYHLELDSAALPFLCMIQLTTQKSEASLLHSQVKNGLHYKSQDDHGEIMEQEDTKSTLLSPLIPSSEKGFDEYGDKFCDKAEIVLELKKQMHLAGPLVLHEHKFSVLQNSLWFWQRRKGLWMGITCGSGLQALLFFAITMHANWEEETWNYVNHEPFNSFPVPTSKTFNASKFQLSSFSASCARPYQAIIRFLYEPSFAALLHIQEIDDDHKLARTSITNLHI
ncbi:hypothetical protein Q3G72_000828 [Acer saccharum]|nr:hypothetical protein Q3G72_000828 [Acer saccharum]